SVCEASFVDGLSDPEIEALFRSARDEDYREIVAEVQGLLKALPSGRRRAGTDGRGQVEADLSRLKRRLADVAAIDFFGAPKRQAAHEELARLEARLRPPAVSSPASTAPAEAPRGATWVTRQGVHVDRIASAWLIHRFIDREARFKFVAPDGYRPRSGELRFDMFEAEYTHEGEACTFETLVTRFGIGDPAIRVIAQIVHDIDYKEAKFGRPETPGIERVIAGIARQRTDDDARLELGAALLDALYAALTATVAGTGRPPSAKRARRAGLRR
ncbi:MAG TPA: chromate resistance protein ChrB domain-containing protein, partial [Gemmatimonadales bacterium]|nr:chromate resistance protein ChrB domain-containing protein [Gemmatimonadales bacterium]